MGRRTSDQKRADQPMAAAISVDVVLGAQCRDRPSFDKLLAAPERRYGLLLYTASFHCPASPDILALCLRRRPVRPLLGAETLLFLDRRLLAVSSADIPQGERAKPDGHLDDGSIDRLSAERQVATPRRGEVEPSDQIVHRGGRYQGFPRRRNVELPDRRVPGPPDPGLEGV